VHHPTLPGAGYVGREANQASPTRKREGGGSWGNHVVTPRGLI
jgi:hypothetical protein